MAKMSGEELWGWAVLISSAVLIFVWLMKVVFLASSILFLLLFIVLIGFLISGSDVPMELIIAMGIFLVAIIFSASVVYVAHETAMGKIVMGTSEDIVFIDNTITDVKTSALASYIEATAPRIKQIEYYNETIQVGYPVNYTENESYYITYPQTIYGENLSFVPVSDLGDVPCNTTSCELSLDLINLKNNYSLLLNMNYTVSIHYVMKEGPKNISLNLREVNLNVSAEQIFSYKKTINYNSEKYPYYAKINPSSVMFEFSSNEFVFIVNETHYREINKTRTDYRNETVTKSKDIYVIDQEYVNKWRPLLWLAQFS